MQLALLGSLAVIASSQLVKIPTMKIGVDVHGRSVDMPMSGVGTWLYNSSVAEAEVAVALDMGATLIDTAHVYGNQIGVGKAIKASGKEPSSLFISTKVPGGLSKAATIDTHMQNLKELGVETADLLLTHFPCGFPTSPTSPPVNCTKAARQTTWQGLEALYKSGKARAIGVSHYCQKHMEDILEIATVPISVNQQEWHIGMGTDPVGVVSFCKKHGISFQSFSPLCGPCPPADHMELINGPLVSSIGKAHGVSGAQISLRWLVEQGSPVIAKSSDPKHIRENIDLFGFSLTPNELKQLNAATSPPSAETVADDCKLPLTVVV